MNDGVHCCCVIPVFDQPQRLSELIDGLIALDLDCIIVDDGSGPATAELVPAIAQRHTRVRALRLEVNSGKGAAVMAGFRQAELGGYSHVLQIDADHQHSLDDVPELLAAAADDPRAVICGARAYADMPRGRRRGRKVTDTWVHINTLSSAIEDSMCGFRVYPLVETLVALDGCRVGRRMDFDTDIVGAFVLGRANDRERAGTGFV